MLSANSLLRAHKNGDALYTIGYPQYQRRLFPDNDARSVDRIFTVVRGGKFPAEFTLAFVLEHKILAAMQVAISGEQFGDDALRQAQRMEEKLQQLKGAVQ